jgi:predicted MPP superfamily phosphohydrolase
LRKTIRLLLPLIALFSLYDFTGIYSLANYFIPPGIRIVVYTVYLLFNLLILGMIGVMLNGISKKSIRPPSQRTSAIIILFSAPNIIFGLILLLQDIFRLIYGIASMVFHLSLKAEYFPGRNIFVLCTALAIFLILFTLILFGISGGKYHFKIKNLNLKFKNLPTAFENFKLVQISDIHSGSFDSLKGVEKGIRLINEQKPDIIVFTGDLVNNSSHEFEPWINVFSTLKAKEGKFSILGNHDYGDYIAWPTPAHKEENMKRLFAIHEETGFKLLLDENTAIERKAESIYILGVENWGLPPFPKRGKLKQALKNVPAGAFKILLSHDPTHWDAEVLKQAEPIQLTLSGHTHGMQFGFEIFGWKWSPVKYRYRRWLGLYREGMNYLYVNRGFGFLGFPGRVGMWPEITVITLQQG